MKYFVPDSVVKDLAKGTFIDMLQAQGGWYEVWRDGIHQGWMVKTNQDIDYMLRGVRHGESLAITD